MSSARRWALQDLWAGLLLAAFGVAALIFGADLAMGTARRMGPGYLPYGLAWLLVLCGAEVALRGVIAAGAAGEARRPRGVRVGRADAPQALPRRARRRACLRARHRPRRHPPRLGWRDPRGGGGRPHEPLGRGRDARRGIDGARRDRVREAPRPQHPALVLATAMDLLANLWLGFSVAVTPTNLLFCLIGALVR